MADDPNEVCSQMDLSIEEKDKLVAEVIRFILFKTHQTGGCPIKRDELTQLVTKNYRQRLLPNLVINEAKEKLASIFGYEMRELQRLRPSSTNQGRASQQSLDAKSYVIISQLHPDVYSEYVEDSSTTHVAGFTFSVLSIIHLAGGRLSEEELWKHLVRLGLRETDESHPVLGNVKLALEALVQQRYIQKNKVNGPEGNILMYELAERSSDPAVAEKLKEYISQIIHDDTAAEEED
ncbi:unnamed protein product [Rhodiola kirilowii]